MRGTLTQRSMLLDEEMRTAFRCLLILLTVVAFGTLGFMFVEREWGLWKSLFFTLITVTTVGYGDEGLSSNGEMFAALLLLFGIGAATYSVTSLVQIAVSYQTGWRRKMQRKIDQLEGHFIICGFGRIGRTVAEQLREEEIPVVIIDANPQIVDAAMVAGYLALQGNSTDDELLQRIGISRARGIICAISSDAENVFVTLCARELNPRLFIASRATTEAAARRMERAGAAFVVSPYTTAGQNIADAVLRPKLAEFLRNRRGEFELGEFSVRENSLLVGRVIREIGIRFPTVAFVALKRGQAPAIVRPGGNEMFQPGDLVTVAGKRGELERLYEFAEMSRDSAAEADAFCSQCTATA